MTQKAFIELVYNDSSTANFEVNVDDTKASNHALLQMITRGTLQASLAKVAHCYNEEGFEICSYTKG